MSQLSPGKWGLTGFALKWIALAAMAVDHVGMTLLPQYELLRIVGRLAFPIYCFLLVEGAVHTANRRRYLMRLLLFALLSEVPFDLAVSGTVFDLRSQNVFFTLAMGLMAVYLMELRNRYPYAVLGSAALVFAAQLAQTDYGGGGVLIILIFYLFRGKMAARVLAFSAVNVLCYGGLQNYAILSMVPILCYNGRRGPRMKYLFYIFYPAHLLALCWLRLRL